MARRRLDVGLVTHKDLRDLDPDDRPLAAVLAARGLSVEPVVWDDPAVDWSALRVAVLRSTWDYFHRREEFLAWARRASGATRLLNPLATVAWNTHKFYLREIAEKGAPVVPTVFLEQGSRAALGETLAQRGWRTVVVKPAVSADSWGTIRANPDTLAEGQAHLDELLRSRDVMIQPFLPSVEETGERCLVFVDGQLSHAVRKRSLFLGGRHAGPEGEPVPIAPDEARVAEEVLRLADQPALLYARVDLARDAFGQPCLMELELVEPTLFLKDHPDACARLASAIAARLDETPS
jgi:glutathione synthase/RimK-type ligase-like ATP-grasp enzyme